MSDIIYTDRETLKAVLFEVVAEAIASPVKKTEERSLVYGLRGLARFLNCSLATANRIKKAGTIPYSQTGRKVIFDVTEIIEQQTNQASSK